ncbi:hypothetical protein C8J57DRAFT_1235627 [Mycena rebaudengoi]|nr:hypothetical protein C8J57DRAFT_1235627 [Mycena rebaudengoi]
MCWHHEHQHLIIPHILTPHPYLMISHLPIGVLLQWEIIFEVVFGDAVRAADLCAALLPRRFRYNSCLTRNNSAVGRYEKQYNTKRVEFACFFHISHGIQQNILCFVHKSGYAFKPMSETFRARLKIRNIMGCYVLQEQKPLIGDFQKIREIGQEKLGALTLVGLLLNLVVLCGLVIVIMGMLMALPPYLVKKQDIGWSVSPEDYTSLWGWVSFRWIYPLVQRGRNVTLNETDVWNLSPNVQSRPVLIKFVTMPLDFIGTLLSILFSYAAPFFLKHILDAVDHPDKNEQDKAYIYAILMFICSVFKRRRGRGESQKGGRHTPALSTEEQKKSKANSDQKLAKEAQKPKAGADIGKIINLLASDTSTVTIETSRLAYYPGKYCVFLYQLFGLSAFAGLAALIVGWPLNTYLTRRSIRIQKGSLKAQDERMGILTELISAAKFIKLCAWEQGWIDRALNARSVEIGWLVQAPILISVLSFLSYVMLGNELTIGTAFTAIAFWHATARVSLNRIALYLDEDEVSEQVSSLKKDLSGSAPFGTEEARLGFENASFKWNEVENPRNTPDTIDSPPGCGSEAGKFQLRDLSIIFPEGELTVVTGPTASGKTALLNLIGSKMALLGEMTSHPGGQIIMSKNTSRIDAWGNMHIASYAAQRPWLRQQSIKDNILFGYPLDETRYNAVLECCALKPDLDMLEDGDRTEIRERGVSLSGGQKARYYARMQGLMVALRVALARAVYAKTKFILLDDPLSAVDSHTSRWLYEKCLCGPLMANRTVILVTHHVQLVMPGAYYLVRMLDGRIDTQGTVQKLRAQGVLEDIVHEAAIEAKEEELAVATEEPDLSAETKKPRLLVKADHREEGGVKWEIYNRYLKASSYKIWAFLAVVVLLLQGLSVVEKLWIKRWGDAYKETNSSAVYGGSGFLFLAPEHQRSLLGQLRSTSAIYQTPAAFLDNNVPNAKEHPLYYVGIYAAIGLTTVVVTLCSSIAQITGALKASRSHFEALLVSVVRAKFRWHDTTPQRRIINQFESDINTIDMSLASSIQQVNSSFAGFFASIVTVTVYLWFIPSGSAPFISWFYYTFSVAYLNTGRDLRRMESTTHSPIYSEFGELLEGIVTVRGAPDYPPLPYLQVPNNLASLLCRKNGSTVCRIHYNTVSHPFSGVVPILVT